MVCWGVAVLLLTLSVWVDANQMAKRAMRPEDSQDNADVSKDQWFEQTLDHREKSNKNTWKHRYFVIKDYYKEGGPAFLVLGGEWAASSEVLKDTAAAVYAKKLNAILFNLEHRFYGESKPTSDLSTDNLRYLTVEQAVEDITSFIAGMNSQYKLPQGIRWIVFGSSYPANLATWVRSKYPDLVYAAVAYSAPLKPKLNFNEYIKHVRDVVGGYDKNCLEAIKQGHAQLKKALTSSDDLGELSKKFKLCHPIDQSNAKDVQSLIQIVADTFVGVVQYKNMWTLQLKDVCDAMGDESVGEFLDRFAKVITLIMNEESTECLDYQNQKYVDQAKDASWDTDMATSGERQWDYQCCTEIGEFQTSDQEDNLFSVDIPLEFFIQRCIDIFGKEFNEKKIQSGIDNLKNMYGGDDVKATRVAFVNGDQDPWMELGITKAKVPESPTILIKGESHGACESGTTDSDSEEFKKGCKQVEDLVTKWSTE